MEDVYTAIALIEDKKLQSILIEITKRLDDIGQLPPASEDPKQIAVIVNKITRNL